MSSTGLKHTAYLETGTQQTAFHDKSVPEPPTQVSTTQDVPPKASVEFASGWPVLVACSIMSFWLVGVSNAWGILQTAVLQSSRDHVNDALALSFVGTLSNTLMILFGTVALQCIRRIGCPSACLIGVCLYALGILTSSFVLSRNLNPVGPLVALFGVLTGTGGCVLFTVTNILPAQYFRSNLGLANRIVKASGGIGGMVLSFLVEALINRVGLPWTFRVLGLMIMVTTIPATWWARERNSRGSADASTAPRFKSTLTSLRKPRLYAIVGYGALNAFAVWVPFYFLPLFTASSLGYPSTIRAACVAGFSVASILGRVASGVLGDSYGALNSLLLMSTLSTLSTWVLWPLAGETPVLVIFIAINGFSNGAFFTTFPTAVASIVDSMVTSVAISLATAGWAPGYLVGAPIAGYLTPESAATTTQPMTTWYPMIFYTGGCSFVASCFAVAAPVIGGASWTDRV